MNTTLNFVRLWSFAALLALSANARADDYETSLTHMGPTRLRLEQLGHLASLGGACLGGDALVVVAGAVDTLPLGSLLTTAVAQAIEPGYSILNHLRDNSQGHDARGAALNFGYDTLGGGVAVIVSLGAVTGGTHDNGAADRLLTAAYSSTKVIANALHGSQSPCWVAARKYDAISDELERRVDERKVAEARAERAGAVIAY